MNINFANAVRPPDRESIRDAVRQTLAMTRALFVPGTLVELRCRVRGRDLKRVLVSAASVAEHAADLYLTYFDRDVLLSISVERPTPVEVQPGVAPKGSALRSDTRVLVVPLVARPNLIENLQAFSLAPNVVIDVGLGIDAAWRLSESIDQEEATKLGGAIATMFKTTVSKQHACAEIYLPGFPSFSGRSDERAMRGDGHDRTALLKNLRFICEPPLCPTIIKTEPYHGISV